MIRQALLELVRRPAEGRTITLPGALLACSGCLECVPVLVLTPHRRGGGNYPLCPACVADAAAWPLCCICDEPSPLAVMLASDDETDGTVSLWCPCVPVAYLIAAGEVLRVAA